MNDQPNHDDDLLADEEHELSTGATVLRCSPGLRGKDRRHLRGLGHSLKATVLVGDRGVHDGVLERIEAELDHRELVKIKLRGADLEERCQAAERIFSETGGAVVQILGRTLLVYRRNDDEPNIKLPQ